MSATNRTDWWVRAAGWLLLAAVVGLLAFCLAWRLDDGRWERVETPSMGTAAPVGTLLWVKPADFDSLRPGDFITFHPPGDSSVTYSHRVYKLNDDGTITTKGVIPGPDPWRLGADDVVGEVRMSWQGVGWLVAAAPVLLTGAFLIAAVRAVIRGRWRLPVTIVLGSLVLTIAIVWYRPFVDAQQLSFTQAESGGADATYVGTGLLPIRLEAHDGPSVLLHDGEVGTVHVSNADEDGRLRIDLRPAIPWWWWALLVLACFVPALYSLAVGLPPTAPRRRRAEPTPAS